MRKYLLMIAASLLIGVTSLNAKDGDMNKARETFLRLTEMNYAPNAEVTETMIRLSGEG